MRALCVAKHDLYGIPICSNTLSPSNSYALKRRYWPRWAELLCTVLIQVKVASRLWAFTDPLQNCARSTPMMDALMLALAVGFFAVSIAYVYACEQL